MAFDRATARYHALVGRQHEHVVAHYVRTDHETIRVTTGETVVLRHGAGAGDVDGDVVFDVVPVLGQAGRHSPAIRGSTAGVHLWDHTALWCTAADKAEHGRLFRDLFRDAHPVVRWFAAHAGLLPPGTARGLQRWSARCPTCGTTYDGATASECVVAMAACYRDAACVPWFRDPVAPRTTALMAWVRAQKVEALLPCPAYVGPGPCMWCGHVDDAHGAHDDEGADATAKNVPQGTPPKPVRPPVARKNRPDAGTTFGGTTYASRLEARWARVFGRLGLRFSYEPTMVTSAGIDRLLADEPGRGTRRWYKPDFFLKDTQEAVEVKPNYPTLRERRLCQEYARDHTPIIMLFGGGTRGQAGGFRYPSEDTRDLQAPGVPCVPMALRCIWDPDREDVLVEAVGLARNRKGRWAFVPQVQADETDTADDRDFLRRTFREAEALNTP